MVRRIPFDVSQSGALASLALWSRVLAIIHLVGAGLALLGICIYLVVAVGGVGARLGASGSEGAAAAALLGVMGVVFIVFAALLALVAGLQGWLLWGAADAFRAVVRTDEADQHYLAQGFGKLRLFFWIEVALAVLSIGMSLVGTAAQLGLGMAVGG